MKSKIDEFKNQKVRSRSKKSILFLGLFLFTVSLYAQKAKLQTAFNYMKYEQLDKAKEAIDEAALHEQTMSMDKTWYYRGLIYQGLYIMRDKYGAVAEGSLKEALKSFNKVAEIDPKSEYIEDIKGKKDTLARLFADQAYDQYSKKDYKGALETYETITLLNPSDTTSYYNAAIMADKINDKTKAKSLYQKLVDINYSEVKFYNSYVKILLDEKDTAKALEIVKTGLSRYPGEKSLIISQANIYLSSGKNKEALESIDQALANDPLNQNLFYAKGNVQEKLGNTESAELSYKKAIEIKTDYFDANYNLGALYFNQGVALVNKANGIKDNKEYAKAKTAFEAKFGQAKPYLEKAHSIDPKDRNTMISLKQLYAQLNDKVNYDLIKAQLDK